jgi:hypothetical protein
MTDDLAKRVVGGRPRDRRGTESASRTCAHEGCATILSRYNKTTLCGVHEPSRTLAATRRNR